MEFARQQDLEQKTKDSHSSSGSLDNNLQLDMEKLGSLSEMADRNLLQRAPKLTIFQTTLTLVASNIGGGLLGMPFAIYQFGLFLGLIVILITATLSHFSSVMYLKVKDLTPRRYESLYEIAYLLIGRASIFIVCTTMFISNFSACVLFYMILGETLSFLGFQMLFSSSAEQMSQKDIMDEIGEYPWWQQLITSRHAAILLIGFAQLFIIFKKQLAELKVLSYIFLAIVILFVCLIFSELMTDSIVVAETIDFDELVRVKSGQKLFTAVTIVIFAFSVQFMVFPAYVELEKRSTERFTQASFFLSLIQGVTHISASIICLLLFGSEINNDLLLNISSRPGMVSVLIRSSFCFLLLFHLPYFFFSVKEYVLVMIDEALNRSLSTNLEQKLSDFYKKKEEKLNNDDVDQFGEKAESGHPRLVKAPETPASQAEDTDALLSGGGDYNNYSDIQNDERGDEMRMKSGEIVGRLDTIPSDTLSACSAKSALTYQSLPDSLFLWTALLLHVSILTIALSLENLDIVFEIAGAIGCSSMFFLFPGIAYILALRKYGRPSHYQRWSTFFFHKLAWAFLVLFFIVLATFFYLQISRALLAQPSNKEIGEAI